MIDALERAKTDDHVVIAMCVLVDTFEHPRDMVTHTDDDVSVGDVNSALRFLHQFDTDAEGAHVLNQVSVGLLMRIKEYGDQKAQRTDDRPARLN